MNHSLPTLALGLALAATAVCTPAQAHDTPACDAIDRLEKDVSDKHFAIGPGFLVNDGDLTLKENGIVVMRITGSGELYLEGRQVELTPRGQELVDAYYAGMDKALGEFAGLAGDAAELGISAAGKAIFRLLTGQLDEEQFEQEVETQARKIEARANLACTYVQEIEQIEAELATEVPGFRPLVFHAGKSI